MSEAKKLNLYGVIGRFVLKLPKGWYILRTHKSDRKFVSKRAVLFMKEYFGDALYTNDKGKMTNRRMGFEDGYLACLKDLGVELRYPKDDL